MFGLQTLDIAIGLIFVYLAMALVTTAIRELLASMTNGRMRNLEEGVRNLLGASGDVSVDALYAHPMIQSLYENGKKPSYIPARTFALSLLDIVAPAEGTQTRTIDSIRADVAAMDNETVRRTLLVLIDDAAGDLTTLHANVETWFNNSMERVSAWYKRRTQWVVIGIAAVVAFAGNVDTLRIVDSLSKDRVLRDSLVAQAQAYAKENPGGPKTTDQSVAAVQESIRKITSLGIPLGWKNEQVTASDVVGKVVGLLLSAFAISLGAPFWFDVLNKIITVRSAGNAPNEKPKPPELEGRRQDLQDLPAKKTAVAPKSQ